MANTALIIMRWRSPCGLAGSASSSRYWPLPAPLRPKKRIQPGLGTMPTHGLLFVALLIGTVILLGALTYVPALALGPVVEHLIMTSVH